MMVMYFVITDNLSYNKFAIQSHTFTGTGYDASNAVDGHTTTCMRTKDIGSTSPDKTVWWTVDLGKVYNINRISILFKNYYGYGVYYFGIDVCTYLKECSTNLSDVIIKYTTIFVLITT